MPCLSCATQCEDGCVPGTCPRCHAPWRLDVRHGPRTSALGRYSKMTGRVKREAKQRSETSRLERTKTSLSARIMRSIIVY